MTVENGEPDKVCLSVDPGVCRFKTKIIAMYEGGSIRFDFETDCPHVKKVKEQLSEEMSPFDALRMPFSANPVYEACGKVLVHSACPIPSAIIKSAEAASGLGLRKAVRFEFEC